MKRKALFAGLSLCLIACGWFLLPMFAASSKTASVAPASVQSVKAQVKPYKVWASLKEVTNLKSFKKVFPLAPPQEKLLAQNLFV